MRASLSPRVTRWASCVQPVAVYALIPVNRARTHARTKTGVYTSHVDAFVYPRA